MDGPDIAVTGLGLVTARAASPEQLFRRIVAGESCVAKSCLLESYGLVNPVGAFLSRGKWCYVRRRVAQGNGDANGLAPHSALALYAARQALDSSGLSLADKGRKGMFVACNKLPMDEQGFRLLAPYLAGEEVDLDGFIVSGRHDPCDYFHRRQDLPAHLLAQRFGLTDVVMTHGDACAAGGIAIATACRYLRQGEIEVALAGGTEVTSSLIYYLFFRLLGALAEAPGRPAHGISRPFDKGRGGFVLGEGSAFLVLEPLERAMDRKARVWATVAGFAKRAEAWHITSSPSDGSEYAKCMAASLKDATASPQEVDNINAHGTSTPANDACEAAAIGVLFGADAHQVPVSATKSATGHLLAGSGAVEAVLSVLSLWHGMVLPTLNFSRSDPDVEFLKIPRADYPAQLRTVLSNSFGFGGENCSLLFRVAPGSGLS